jgi:hypothetical protein
MFNLAVGSMHPSVICVEVSKFGDSLNSLQDVLESPYVDEELTEFIENYARTDEILPSDKTIGFVVANSSKKIISFSFSTVSEGIDRTIRSSAESFREKGYTVEIDTQ